MLKSVSIKENTTILTGQHPLWAEIDGITPSTLKLLGVIIENGTDIDKLSISPFINKEETVIEGKDYMLELAERNNIQLDVDQPFITYKPTDVQRAEFIRGQTYPNYLNPDKEVLTETIMSKDLLIKYMGDKVKIDIIDTELENGQRPTTNTTARDAAQQFITKINNKEYEKQKEFVIYFQSNQPYVKFQTLRIQREINKPLQENELNNITVTVDRVGFANKQDIVHIYSKVGALLNEKYIDTVIK